MYASTALMALGAFIGISLAGYSLFTAKGTVTRHVPPEDVALVNGRPILMSDFRAQAESTFSLPFSEIGAAQLRTVLDAMIREELYVQRGLELDFPSTDPDTRSALVAAVEQQAVADATTELPSEAALRAYYDAHRASYSSEGTMLVQDLFVVPGRMNQSTDPTSVASAAAAALRAGKLPEEVLKRYGLVDKRASSGEEFYFAARIHLGERLFEVARALRDRSASEPIHLSDGIHILYMIRNSPPVAREFAQAREQVFGDYKRARATQLRAADEQYLYGKAQIEIAAGFR